MTTRIATEFFKLRTTHSPWLLLIAAQAVIVAGVGGLIVSGADVHLATTPVDAVRHAGLISLFTLILGIMAVAGEYRHKTITDTFLATPRRSQVIVAKLIAYTATGVAFGIMSAATALIATAIWLAASGASLDLSNAELWRTVIGGIVWNATFAAIGVGLGALVRNLTGAIAVALAWAALVEGIIGQLIGRFSQWLPISSGTILDGIRSNTTLLPQWGAGLVLVGYASLFAILAVFFTMRRDVA